MTTLLAALNSNSSAEPVLRTAVSLAGLFDASVVALHVTEEGVTSRATELARAAGVELRETQVPRSSRSWRPRRTRTLRRSSSARGELRPARNPRDTPRWR